MTFASHRNWNCGIHDSMLMLTCRHNLKWQTSYCMIEYDFLRGVLKVRLAPRAGLEPAARRLTAVCSTTELPGNTLVYFLPEKMEEC